MGCLLFSFYRAYRTPGTRRLIPEDLHSQLSNFLSLSLAQVSFYLL